MPIRIKPVYELNPCVLNLDSIEKITALVKRDFPSATFAATDKVWEIYDEDSRDNFLSAVTQRQTLDSFVVTTPRPNSRELELRFTEDEAKALYKGSPDDESWFEHFLIDLKKHILPPTFRQLVAFASKFGASQLYFKVPLLIIPIDIEGAVSTPYCRIVIRQRPPSQFIENVKANLVSNLIWVVITFAFGVVATLVAQYLLSK